MFSLINIHLSVLVGGVLHPDKVGVGFHTDAVAGMETGDHPSNGRGVKPLPPSKTLP
jgi:hypothetical protein